MNHHEHNFKIQWSKSGGWSKSARTFAPAFLMSTQRPKLAGKDVRHVHGATANSPTEIGQDKTYRLRERDTLTSL